MKMKPSDYKALKELIIAHPQEIQNLGDFDNLILWDQLWCIPPFKRIQWFDRGIYRYLNDNHITTALRHIKWELENEIPKER